MIDACLLNDKKYFMPVVFYYRHFLVIKQKGIFPSVLGSVSRLTIKYEHQ